jgi:hypothetical protein
MLFAGNLEFLAKKEEKIELVQPVKFGFRFIATAWQLCPRGIACVTL